MLRLAAALATGASVLLLLAIAYSPSSPQSVETIGLVPTRYFARRGGAPVFRVSRGQRLYADPFAEPEPDYSQEMAVMEGIEKDSQLNEDYYLAKYTDMDHTFPEYKEPNTDTWNERVWCSTPSCDYTGLDSAEFASEDFPAARSWLLSY